MNKATADRGLRIGASVAVVALVGVVACADGQSGTASAWTERAYEPSDADIANPERGLYVELDDRRQRPLDAARLRRLTEDRITLVQRLYYLKGYRDRPLDAEQLRLIRADFAAIRDAGMKVILRFAYSSRIGEPDAPLPIVLGHVRQLRPLLQEHADLILTMQAGFIGAWGEWHSSTHGLTEPAAMREVAFALLDALPADRTIQVRTPKHKQLLLPTDDPLPGPPSDRTAVAARVGHHNDCFLADRTDTGTYRQGRLEADRSYVANDSRYVPVGGETCRPGGRSEPGQARDELRLMHWSFLNLAYHREVIANWRETGFLSEVRRKLGYRLRLERVKLPTRVVEGGVLRGEVVVANEGWAAPIHDRPIELVFAGADDGPVFIAEVGADLRDALPGERQVWSVETPLPAGMPVGAYAVRLRLPDPSARLRDDSRYTMRLANAGLRPTPDGSADLGIEIAVTRRQ